MIRSEAEMYAGKLTAGITLEQKLAGRHGWLQVAAGEITVNQQTLHAGDGVAISDEASIAIQAVTDAELLLFDLE